ncbi:hypothetical protein [Bacteriovorax sp. Seq25_V]|uniref:hypothetical protein n=1 Tax=Bacteriovorax sp. Seq25_V TaxID=1201288 RepID=UPI000389FD97|nr:hypothetical protein [Bacteriovorax sp. Seq25_V]EQC43804.1 hypothetical protein M900_1231 [Bacteriovorax sp. Seq25_V]
MNSEKDHILQVVRSFYAIAINDVFIGYHFRKISSDPNGHKTIHSDLGAFEDHIPKVVDFWASQLIEGHTPEFNRPNVLKIHEYLKIRRGEVGRWIVLFKENLSKHQSEETKSFNQRWLAKIDLFEAAFIKYYFSAK